MTSPDCLRAFFRKVFMDNTEDEALALWGYLCDGGSAYPQRALACVDAAVADPPEDLVDTMREHGWISLVHRGSSGVTPYTFDEHVQWLRAMAERLRERMADSRAAASSDGDEAAGESSDWST